MIASMPSRDVTAEPKRVSITINGQEVPAVEGQTVLEAATAAGIDIPTLCHHPALSNQGSCRMCVVEIDRQRNVQPSCTYPVSGGMVVQTESPRVVDARKFVLNMLFSERSHYCMFCSSSGSALSSDCELQKLAYRYGMDCWSYAPDWGHAWAVDASRKYFVMDQGRCILCRRCVRACSELVANHTLDVSRRGAGAMICADDDMPFGSSTCVSCGTCLDVCPTGALMDRRSAFMAHGGDIDRCQTTCMACAVGCQVSVVTHRNQLLRVESVWDDANRGVLCEDGRFRILDRPLDRLTTPLMRRDGALAECSWDEALAAVANRLARSPKVAGLVSPALTNETLVAFTRFFHDVLHSDEVALFHANVPPLGLGEAATLSDIDAADCIVILRANPFEHQKVLAYATRRAMDRGARLVVVDVDDPDLENMADVVVRLPQAPPREEMAPAEALNYTYHLRADRLAEIRAPLDSARSPVLMYGSGMESEFYLALRALPVKTRFLPLVRGANTIGASRLGLKARPVHAEALYVLAGDDQPGDEPLPEAAFRVVQSAYRTGWVEAADVALPAQIPFEMRGHMLNIEGHRRVVAPAVQSPAGVLPDWTTPFLLSVRLGQPLACMTVTDFAGADA